MEPLVTRSFSFIADGRNVRLQHRISPVVTRRLLRIAGYAVARSFQQRLRGRGIEAGVITGRQVELATGPAGIVTIVVDERAGQENALGWVADEPELRISSTDR